MAAYVSNIVIDVGANFDQSFNLETNANAPMNLTGFSGAAKPAKSQTRISQQRASALVLRRALQRADHGLPPFLRNTEDARDLQAEVDLVLLLLLVLALLVLLQVPRVDLEKHGERHFLILRMYVERKNICFGTI